MRFGDFKTYQKILTVMLILAAFGARVHRLSIPVEWVFDEIYHAYSAEMYALNDPRGYEWWHPIPQGLALEWLHPPVEKLMMAGSILVFSHPFEPFSQTNPPLDASTTFAWRFPAAVCTSLTVFIIILLGVRMFNFPVGFLAGLFYAIDPMSITHGRLGTSDGIYTFFSTLAFYRLYIFLIEYPREHVKNLIWLSISVGLAFSTKFTGTFNIIWTGVFTVLFFVWKRYFTKMKKYTADYSIDRLFLMSLIYGLVIFNVYLLSYTQWWLQRHTWQQFYELHNQIVRYHVGLRATHPFSSHPLSWPIMQKPVWVYMGKDEFGKDLNIYSTGNKATWWGGLGVVLYLCVVLLAKFISAVNLGKIKAFLTNTNLKIMFLLGAYFGMFLPWALSPRILFLYHYLPSLPFLFILLALGLYYFSGFLLKRVNNAYPGLIKSKIISSLSKVL